MVPALRRLALVALALLEGCTDPGPTVQGTGPLPSGPCGRAVAVVHTDYQSTAVSVVGWDGAVLADPLATSAELGLSGDVVVPTSPSEEVVLIDRFPAAVLTRIDPETATVRDQLSLATGFASNPQDMVPLATGPGERPRVLVTRFGVDLDPGSEPFDGGSDALVLGGEPLAIESRIDLRPALGNESPPFYPRANRAVSVEGRVFVLLGGYALDFLSGAEGRLVELDGTGALVGVTVLEGLRGCHALATSPSGARLAVGCSGGFGGTSAPNAVESAMMVFDVGETLTERGRLRPSDLSGKPFSFSLQFLGESTLLAGTFGSLDAGPDAGADELWAIELDAGSTTSAVRVVATSAFALGEVRCPAAPMIDTCGCFVADAARDPSLSLLTRDAEGSWRLTGVPVGMELGLPARFLGEIGFLSPL
jgi:hypothetical protein